ncbi:hypothetical protein V2J09_016755 [Rumex salicifolius]
MDSLCIEYHQGEESLTHLFCDCPSSKDVRVKLGDGNLQLSFSLLHFKGWFKSNVRNPSSTPDQKWRNMKTFKDERMGGDKYNFVLDRAKEFHSAFKASKLGSEKPTMRESWIG